MPEPESEKSEGETTATAMARLNPSNRRLGEIKTRNPGLSFIPSQTHQPLLHLAAKISASAGSGIRGEIGPSRTPRDPKS
jgi:hypothetical protein